MSVHARGLSQILLVSVLVALGGMAWAAEGATKDEAVAMVQEGRERPSSPTVADKAYAEIDDPGRPVRRPRSLYRRLRPRRRWCSPMAPTPSASAPTRSTTRTPTARSLSRSASSLPRRMPSFWQSYKFMNPVTNKVEPKQMYCERLEQTVVCGGVYQCADGLRS